MTSHCLHCNKTLYGTRQEAERAVGQLRAKHGYTGRPYWCKHGGGFHIGRNRKEIIKKEGMRKYKRFDKRREYSKYTEKSKSLHAELKAGLIKQEEFDRAHELLDEKFNWVR